MLIMLVLYYPTNANKLYEVIGIVATYATTIPITSYNDICNRSQHCNSGEAQAESSLMMVYVNRNMLE